MDLLWLLIAFGCGVILGAIGAGLFVQRETQRYQQQVDPDWFWQGGADVEWRPYSE